MISVPHQSLVMIGISLDLEGICFDVATYGIFFGE